MRWHTRKKSGTWPNSW